VRPEGLGKFKNHLIGYRTRDLPACSIVLYRYATAFPRVNTQVEIITDIHYPQFCKAKTIQCHHLAAVPTYCFYIYTMGSYFLVDSTLTGHILQALGPHYNSNIPVL
jgi:hypothetical protein